MYWKTLFYHHKKTIAFYAVTACVLGVGLPLTSQTIQAYEPQTDVPRVSSVAEAVETPFLETDEAVMTALENSFTVIATTQAEVKEAAQKMEAATPKGLPLEGVLTSPFGQRSDPATGKTVTHDGVDLGVAQGTPVCATADGVVVYADYRDDYGYMVILDHQNGYETVYAHNNQLTVSVGDTVSRGDVVAYSGNTGYSTGPHLHYEIRLDGVCIDPLA